MVGQGWMPRSPTLDLVRWEIRFLNVVVDPFPEAKKVVLPIWSLAEDFKIFRGWEKTPMTVGRMRCSNCQMTISVHGSHFGRFSLPISIIILNDAKRIYPNVFEAEGPCQGNGIPKSIRQVFLGYPPFAFFVCWPSSCDDFSGPPAVAKTDISALYRFRFNQLHYPVVEANVYHSCWKIWTYRRVAEAFRWAVCGDTIFNLAHYGG
jgi:hypothetical protein